MDTFVVLVITVTAIILVSLAGRALGKRSGKAATQAETAKAAGFSSPADIARPELVAVIAAAVAAASGMAPGSFRIMGIEPSNAGYRSNASYGSRGFNTPIWGHVERFNRGE